MLDEAVGVIDPRGREQHLGARVLQRVAELRGGVALVERDEHHSRAGNRLIELEVAVAVGTDDGDAVPGAHAEAVKRPDQPAGPLHICL